MTLRHLIWLYPPAWRARYGAEFREIIGARRATPGVVFDIITGAIDAWLEPQTIVVASRLKDTAMKPALMNPCAAESSGNTRDRAIGATALFAATLALTGVYLYLSARYRGSDLVDAFGICSTPLC